MADTGEKKTNCFKLSNSKDPSEFRQSFLLVIYMSMTEEPERKEGRREGGKGRERNMA